MKKGDKILCIKSLTNLYYSDEIIPFNNEISNLLEKLEKEEITEDEFDIFWVEFQEKKKEFSIFDKLLTKNKTYEIIDITLNLIKIKCDTGKIIHLSFYDHFQGYNYEDYFITLKESRKNKLRKLSDKNFNQFLKKIKNKV